MAEFRTDPLRGHTALINAQRGNRPSEFSLKINTASPESCVFCRGREEQTPPSIEQDQSPNWNYRLFPNRFPAVSADACAMVDNEFVQFALGSHEVLVETADHYAQASEYSTEKWIEIFEIWQRRLRTHYNDPLVKYVHIFRNQGYRGGATLVHPHQQIVGLPIVPDVIKLRIERSAHLPQNCAYCDWVGREIQSEVRVLEVGDGFVSLVSFAPRFPYEWQIMPRMHQRFDELGDAQLAEIAESLLNGLRAMKRTCNDPDFNLLLFSSPIGSQESGSWCLDILPRMSTQAGFEWGTGVHIVSTPPEEAVLLLLANWGKTC